MVDVRKEQDPERLRQVAVLLENENARLHRQLQTLAEENARLKGLEDGGQGKLGELIEELAAANAAANAGNASERRGRKRRARNKPPKKRTAFGPNAQAGIARTIELFELAPEQQVCHCCGEPLEAMTGGFEESEYVDLVERSFRVVKVKRQKYKKTCECAQPVVTAPGPEAVTLGGRYSLALISAIAVAKYFNHQPLRRQERDFARIGLVMSAQSMFASLWLLSVHASASYSALRDETLRGEVVHIDETSWRALDAKDSVRQLWGMTSKYAAFYRVLDNRSSEGARAMLGEYKGWVMCDGLAVYGKAARLAGYRLGGCLAHGRRYLFKCESDFPQVIEALDWIDELFMIEREIDEAHGDDLAARKRVRRQRSAPLMKRLKAWLDSERAPPGSNLDKAIKYLRPRWHKFELILEHPELPLSNNAAELALRPSVIGRKNFGGTRGRRGEIVSATLYSLIESARLVGVDPAAYLVAVAQHDLAHPDVPLLPREYKARLESGDGGA